MEKIPVVPNVLKFDILLPETVLAIALQVFWTSLTSSQYCEIWMKSWLDSVHGTLSLNLSWVFDVETIAGCQIIRFFLKISKLVSDFRKMYHAKHLGLQVLPKILGQREGHTGQTLCYLIIPESLKILVSRYHQRSLRNTMKRRYSEQDNWFQITVPSRSCTSSGIEIIVYQIKEKNQKS